MPIRKKYIIYQITGEKVILRSFDLPVNSILRQQLQHNSFEFTHDVSNLNNQNPEGHYLKVLIIFLANHPEFWHLKFLRPFLDAVRVTSIMESKNENTSIKNKVYQPILTIYSEDSFKMETERQTRFGVQYWDSCIWQRWINAGEVKNEKRDDNYANNLKKVLDVINWYFDRNLYDLYLSPVSFEYLDFSTRLYKNSFLLDLDVKSSSHAKHVTPFPFFKESEFQKKVEDEKNNFENLNGLVWRILLVDDKKEKLDYLIRLLTQYLEILGISFFNIVTANTIRGKVTKNLPTLIINQAKTIESARNELTKQVYDIILLDYLLGKENGSDRETGMHLINELHSQNSNDKSEKLPYKKSVSDKFWIFLISSYPSAFLDAVRNQGYSLNSNDWIIERGATPLHTPNYFLYSFTKFLNRFLCEATSNTTVIDIWKDCIGNLSEFTRGWAISSLTEILNFYTKIEALKKLQSNNENVINGFADSFFDSKQHDKIDTDFKNGLYGYITHLLFMLAYSDGYEWEEMKTDFEMIKSLINDQTLDEKYVMINNRIEVLKAKYDP